MTDFLTKLAARSFGSDTAILPRVASLFEPVATVDSELREAPMARPVETAISGEVEPTLDGARKMNHPASTSRRDDQAADAMYVAREDAVSVAASQPRSGSAHHTASESAADGSQAKEAVIPSTVRKRRFPLSQEQTWNESHPLSVSQSHLEDSETEAPFSRSGREDRALNESLSPSDSDDTAQNRISAAA